MWSEAYHRAVARIFDESLPESYQRDMAALFADSAESMKRCHIPAGLAEDWSIVVRYLACSSTVTCQWLASKPEPSGLEGRDRIPIDDRVPFVIRFDRIAAVASHGGALRLERAALASQRYLAPAPLEALDDQQRRLLSAVASGTAISDLADEFGYSRRTMYRELAKLWQALGVRDRYGAIRKATAAGLID